MEVQYRIPILDCSSILANYENDTERKSSYKKFAGELGRGIEDTGIVYLINHGLEGPTLTDMLGKCKEFFELPHDVKDKYKMTNVVEDLNGYMPFRGITVSNLTANDAKRTEDLREFYAFTFPPKNFVFPSEVANWNKAVDTLLSKFGPLAHILFRCFALHLNLDEETFVLMHRGIIDPSVPTDCSIGCNYYFPVAKTEQLAGDTMRLVAHRDFPSLTLLVQDSVGLEFESTSGKWITVPVIPRAVILNVGFMMELWSGGQLPAVNHRVRMIEQTQPRQSLAMFWHPDHEAPCRSLQDKISNWVPPYSYVENETYHQYFLTKLKKLVNK